jgi:hypothetical protein
VQVNDCSRTEIFGDGWRRRQRQRQQQLGIKVATLEFVPLKLTNFPGK